MCNSVCGNFVRLPWIMQLVIPFIGLIAMGMAFGPGVEQVVCVLCN